VSQREKMKVLLIRAGALGDTLMLMPAIAFLRKKAEITLVGRYPGIDYLKPYVDQCIDYERSGWYRLFMEWAGENPVRGLQAPDQVVAFLGDPEGGLVERLRAWFPDASIRIFPVFPPEQDNIHIALYMALSIEAAGLPIKARLCFEDSFKMPLMTDQHPSSRNGGIVLHPGSGSADKNYPGGIWLNLIRLLKDRYRGRSRRIVLLLGPAEEGLLPFFRKTLHEGDAELIYCPEKEELIRILSQAPLYIGHDSGITHLAAMMGLSVIAVFRKSSPERWSPLGPAVRIIRAENEGLDPVQDTVQKMMDLVRQFYTRGHSPGWQESPISSSFVPGKIS
jgi:heptosyltransferase III